MLQLQEQYITSAQGDYIACSNLSKATWTHQHISKMKFYSWNPDKNKLLQLERNISFEEIVFHIQSGDEIEIFDHPNQERYPNQKISVVVVEGYVYLIPFVESEEGIFLKTIIPSRKATKKYLGETRD